ncbi:MAG: hypothetical protein M3253_07415, partial [Chloroflexota bacterium]|nr:hypothetical protein [Chloroflexota bacterium]
AAEKAIRAGAIFGLFPEVGRAARPPELRRLSSSVAYFAVRTGAPIVPLVFGGTHELYLRRRIVVEVLPPIQPSPAASATGRRRASAAAHEREAAESMIAELRARVEPVAAAAHLAAEPPPRMRKLLRRWLTGPYPQAD